MAPVSIPEPAACRRVETKACAGRKVWEEGKGPDFVLEVASLNTWREDEVTARRAAELRAEGEAAARQAAEARFAELEARLRERR